MTNLLVFSALGLYIMLLVLFTRLVKSSGDNNAFFRAGRKSPWLLVAFGMIGASISGVSLVSVPGWVNKTGMTYIQMCLGFFAGFVTIAYVLLPLYYRLRLTSIYGYLAERFGRRSHLTGACFFLLSKLMGAAARLFLTCTVLHEMAIRPLGLPFGFTVGIVLLAIFLYTRKGGIENIVRTDALQTLCMLLATGCIVWSVSMKMNLTSSCMDTIIQSPMGQMFCWDPSSTQFFLRQFINGMFITIVMNGIDQDMMQKNLTCSSLRAAQKNMCLYGLCILPVNLLFLALGVLLYTFAAQQGLAVPDAGDRLLPMLVGSGALGTFVVFPFTSLAHSASRPPGSRLCLCSLHCRLPLRRQRHHHRHHLSLGRLHIRPVVGALLLRPLHAQKGKRPCCALHRRRLPYRLCLARLPRPTSVELPVVMVDALYKHIV